MNLEQTQFTRDDLLKALVNEYYSISSLMGMLNATGELLEGDVAFELGCIVEGGLPEQRGALRVLIGNAGGEIDEKKAWLSFCRGYQTVVYLRDRPADPEILRADPVQWLNARWEAAADLGKACDCDPKKANGV